MGIGYLVAPMEPGLDGSRTAACPVCVAGVVVPPTAGGWTQLRCPSCGTDFHASDGTGPPPVTIEDLHRNLMRWVEAGEPDRWVESHAGTWGEFEFERLVEALTASAFWPLNLVDVRHAIAEAAGRYRAARAKPAVPKRGERLFAHWKTEIPELAEGKWYVCPACWRVHIQILDDDDDLTRITCPGCLVVSSVQDICVALPKEDEPRVPDEPRDVPAPLKWLFHGIWGAFAVLLVVLLVCAFIGALARVLEWFGG